MQEGEALLHSVLQLQAGGSEGESAATLLSEASLNAAQRRVCNILEQLPAPLDVKKASQVRGPSATAAASSRPCLAGDLVADACHMHVHSTMPPHPCKRMQHAFGKD